MAKEKKEEPIVEFGVNFGGMLKGLGEFINLAVKLAEEGKTELERTGEITHDQAKKLRGMYGVNIRISPMGLPIISRFGTIKPGLELGAPEVREPLTDVFDKKEQIIVTAELPGIEEKDIKIDVEDEILKISAETRDRRYNKEITLSSGVTKEIESTYKNGVLEIKLKKKAE